ncbi:MAG: GDP-mannose 4,6-dehydratase [Fimbriimonadaceae bacterium]|nr:GDP-mannose 4,6-dehydratase [Fimbriimonadaceae bacterium]
MRAVVTGGAGFLGSHLVDFLRGQGAEVLVLDNFITGQRRNIAHLVSDPHVQIREHDASYPFDVDGPVDIVFHLASAASPADFARIPIEVLRAGSFATHNCLELCERKGATFFLASTSEVYGDPLEHPQSESYWGHVNSVGPRACYDEAKRYAEAVSVTYRDHKGVQVRIARFFNTYGPRMRLEDGRVVPNFIRQALRGEPLTVYGDGRQTRSFGYYRDIIDGIWRLVNSSFQEPVNLGTHEERTILAFAHAVISATGSQSSIVHMPAAVDDPQQRHPDISRANFILNWYPQTSLEEGLRETIDYFRSVLDSGE